MAGFSLSQAIQMPRRYKCLAHSRSIQVCFVSLVSAELSSWLVTFDSRWLASFFMAWIWPVPRREFSYRKLWAWFKCQYNSLKFTFELSPPCKQTVYNPLLSLFFYLMIVECRKRVASELDASALASLTVFSRILLCWNIERLWTAYLANNNKYKQKIMTHRIALPGISTDVKKMGKQFPSKWATCAIK